MITVIRLGIRSEDDAHSDQQKREIEQGQGQHSIPTATTTNTNNAPIQWQRWCCRACDRLLSEVDIQQGSTRLICRRCGSLNTLHVGRG